MKKTKNMTDITKDLPTPPKRAELSDTPVKLSCEISRIWRARIRANQTDGSVMSQPGARLILSFLAIGDGTTQLELVRATHLRAPSVSAIVRKMEDEGLIHRESDPTDKRAVRVYLTDEGRALDAATIASIKELDARALEGLSDTETAELMRLLTKIRNNLLEKEIGDNGKNS